MSILDPTATTVNDILTQSLKDSGALGIGQDATSEDINDAWFRFQGMMQQWQRKRYMCYGNVTYIVQSTTQTTPYSVGPSGGPGGTPQFVTGIYKVNSRPNQIESAFFQQTTTGGGNLSPIVYPLRLWRAMEDYRKVSLPSLTTFPLSAFYDPAFASTDGFGQLYVWPWPNNPQYSIGIVVRENLPNMFANAQGQPNLTTIINLPPEYLLAIVHNVAILLRPKYGIGTYPGDQLPALAKDGMETIRKGSTQIANLQMPGELVWNGNYNIFSDQSC